MAVEIRNLTIKATIRKGGEVRKHGATISTQERQRITNDCVERILEILKDRREP